MVGLARDVENGGDDVIVFEEGVVAQDFLVRSAGGEKVEDVGDAAKRITVFRTANRQDVYDE